MKPPTQRSFGLFTIKNFLSPEECARIRLEMSASEGNPASIFRSDQKLLDEDTRRTVAKSVQQETRDLISGKMAAVKGDIEVWFGVDLSHPQSPQFLYYRAGDFFHCHQDNVTNPMYPQEVKDRVVSAIIFLNDENNEPGNDTYSGGSFIIYGLLNDPRFENQGFKVTGTGGTLIAFLSDKFHEVTPVTSGVRYTVVSWFV